MAGGRRYKANRDFILDQPVDLGKKLDIYMEDEKTLTLLSVSADSRRGSCHAVDCTAQVRLSEPFSS